MDISSQIEKLLELKKLYENGILTKEELESEKQKILGSNQEATDSHINNNHFERTENDLPQPEDEIAYDRIEALKQYYHAGALSYEELAEETAKIKQDSQNVENDLTKKTSQTNPNNIVKKTSLSTDIKHEIIKSINFPVVIILVFFIGIFIFHMNYVYTDYWIEEEIIIGSAIGILFIILLAYYLIKKKTDL